VVKEAIFFFFERRGRFLLRQKWPEPESLPNDVLSLFGWTAYLLIQVVNGINVFLLKKKKGKRRSPRVMGWTRRRNRSDPGQRRQPVRFERSTRSKWTPNCRSGLPIILKLFLRIILNFLV
jgi:hypothetical protein